MDALYSIVSDIKSLLDQTDENGEMTPDAEAALDQLQHDLPIKVDNVAAYMRSRKARAESFDVEIERMKALKATEERAADRLKKYLFESLNALNITKLATDRFKFSVCKNSTPSVDLEEGAEIPKAFARVTIELDKDAVKKAYKAGEYVPPTITVETRHHLRIS